VRPPFNDSVIDLWSADREHLAYIAKMPVRATDSEVAQLAQDYRFHWCEDDVDFVYPARHSVRPWADRSLSSTMTSTGGT